VIDVPEFIIVARPAGSNESQPVNKIFCVFELKRDGNRAAVRNETR
jgi:hypothetical protein